MNDSRARRLAFTLFFVSLALLALHRLFAYDIWWQIAAGDWIRANGWPQTDPFSYGFPNGEWIEPRWLFCLAVSFVWQISGATGLILFKVTLVAAAFAAWFRALRDADLGPLLVGALATLLLVHERLLLRPELISFIAIPLVLAWWPKAPRRLVALQLVWSNAHTLWILGPAIIWILTVGEILQRKTIDRSKLLIAVIVSLVPLLNPWGLAGALNPIRLFLQIGEQHPLGQTIHEFQSPFSATFFAADFRTITFLAVIALSLVGWWMNRKQLNVGHLLLFAAFLFLAVRAQRNVALFGLIAGWTLALNMTQAGLLKSKARLIPIAAVTLWSLLTTFGFFYPAIGSEKQFGFGIAARYPVQALDAIDASSRQPRIFNTLGDGGYVLFRGGADSVYVDGRLEVYSPQQLQTAIAATTDAATFQSELQRTAATHALVRLLPAHSALIGVMERNPNWLPIFHNGHHVVYARRDAITQPTAVIDWQRATAEASTAAEYRRLATLYIAVSAFAPAEQALQAAYKLDPNEPTVRRYLGTLRQLNGDDATSILGDLQPDNDLDTQLFAAEFLRQQRRPDEAVAYYRRAIELGSDAPQTAVG